MPFIAIHHEASPGFGEDAEPILDEGPGGSFALGVFDGLGGSGGARYDVDGVERKGAYIASRLAREVTGAELRGALAFSAPTPREARDATAVLARRITDRLREEFARAATKLGGEPSRLRSSMVRVLPTTAAIAVVGPRLRGPDGEDVRIASAIWAGDSRVYALSAAGGLAQVSRDDIRVDADALTSLSSDPPISNCISASQPFALRHASWEVKEPCIVLTATDGCFGYLPTPAHFELELLNALVGESSPEAGEQRLGERIAAVTRDDATLAAAIVDLGEPERMRDGLHDRRELVNAEFIAPYSEHQKRLMAAERDLAEAVTRRDALVEDRDRHARELWARYRIPYEQLLAPTSVVPSDERAR